MRGMQDTPLGEAQSQKQPEVKLRAGMTSVPMASGVVRGGRCCLLPLATVRSRSSILPSTLT